MAEVSVHTECTEQPTGVFCACFWWLWWSDVCGASRFPLDLLRVSGFCEPWSVAVWWQVSSLICCSNSPRSGRISGAAKAEGDKLLGRSGTRHCQKAALFHEVGEGRSYAPISDLDPQLLCSPEGSRGGHGYHGKWWGRLRAPHPAITIPSTTRGKKATSRHPYNFGQTAEV
jgi:hypothetical protein